MDRTSVNRKGGVWKYFDILQDIQPFWIEDKDTAIPETSATLAVDTM